MPSVETIIEEMRRNPRNIRFAELVRVRNRYFEKPRQRGSHISYRATGASGPRICIQNVGGYAKPYQVKQVLAAIDEREDKHGV